MRNKLIIVLGSFLVGMFGIIQVNAQATIKLDGKDVTVADFYKPLILEKDVKQHEGIDAIYKTFSEGYRTLKPEMVANIYTEDAAYLSPNDEITNGRAAILENFSSFFDSVKNREQTMTLSFQIFQRKVEKNMGYDVGIYTIKFYKDDKEVGESKGKFVVVAVKGKDKKWRFQVDGYSSLKPQDAN